MCGIVGLIKTEKNYGQKNRAMFMDMLYADVVRGHHSTGAFKVVKGAVDWRKAATPAWEFFNLKGVPEFLQALGDASFLCGHNRAATRGAVKNDNAHPFESGHITLVHNGTLHSTHALPGKFDVDSHGIANAIAEFGIEKASPKLDGPYSLVWYNSEDKTLNLLRNKDRPMYLGYHKDFVMFGSEAGLLRWIAGRYGFALDKVEETDVHKVYSFEEGSGVPSVKTVDAYRFQTVYKTPSCYGNGYFSEFGEDLGEDWEAPKDEVKKVETKNVVITKQNTAVTISVSNLPSVFKLRSPAMKKQLELLQRGFQAGIKVQFSLEDYMEAPSKKFVTISGDIPNNNHVLIKGNYAGTIDSLDKCKTLLSGVITQSSILRNDNKIMVYLKDIRITTIPDPFYAPKKEDTTVIDSTKCSSCTKPLIVEKGWVLLDKATRQWQCLCSNCKSLQNLSVKGVAQ